MDKETMIALGILLFITGAMFALELAALFWNCK
jgi:hypothetical protein